jgi:predicted KAP-like P-loop ATPase
MWHDNETDRDFLNFTSVANTVAEIIVQAQGRPVSIGVSGAWGVGKSSMIKLIRRELEKRSGQGVPEFLFVEFNAWLYQGYDDARAALLDVIGDALAKKAEEKKKGIDKVKEILKRVDWLRVAKLTAGTTAALALGLPPVGLLGEVFQLGKKAASGQIDQEAIKQGEQIATEVGKTAVGLIKPSVYTSPPKEIQAIRDYFEEALSEIGITLVVLIDDLDRCLPPTTISTLEAIRLFLFLKNTAFVIAADKEMIKHAVKQHFEGVEDTKLITSYFDKLIQVPIQVPPLGTQEVRAYLILLHVENSSLDGDKKEEIRTAICKQLSQTWQGKRVDRAFIESLGGIPADLVAKLDVADRLAPIMTTASNIAGNPRLIKRFLNALSIRMAIAKSHNVSVDEAALAKMLLFERCGDSATYADLLKRINENSEGKPGFLAEYEETACRGEKPELKSPWDKNIDFILEWFAIPPRLSDIDLRGILYVSREHAPIITPEDRLSSEAAELLSALLQHPEESNSIKERLKNLTNPELAIIMGKLLDKARREQEWGTPPILEACLTIADIASNQQSRIASFLMERPPQQIKPNIVLRISDKVWSSTVFEAWEKSAISNLVKRAIKTTREKR